MNYAFQDH
jgi:protein kinase A